MNRPNPRLGYALVLTGAGLFVINAGVSRVVLRSGVAADELASLRLTGTAVCLLLFAALFYRRALPPPSGRQLLVVIGIGLSGTALLQWTYLVAIDRLTVGLALLLEYLAPLMVALWARFVQHERVRVRLWWALALSVLGLAAMTQIWRGLHLDPLGVAAGLGAAVSLSTYLLLGEHGVSAYDPVRLLTWAYVFGAAAFSLVTPVTWLSVDRVSGSTSLLGVLEGVSAPVWVLLVWVVVLGTLLPFAAEFVALRHLPATAVVIAAMLEPVGANLIGWGWFGESLNAIQLLGGIAVLTGIYLSYTARRQQPVAEPPVHVA